MSRIQEGLIEVPKKWLKEYESVLQKFFADRIAASMLINLYSDALDIIGLEQKLNDSSNEKLNAILTDAIPKRRQQLEDNKKDLQKFSDSHNAYIPNDVEYIDFEDKDDFENLQYDITYSWSLSEYHIDVDPSDFSKYSIEKDCVLPDIYVNLDLQDKMHEYGKFISQGIQSIHAATILLSKKLYDENSKTILNLSDAEKQLKKYVSVYLSTFEHECIHYVQKYILPSEYFYNEIDSLAYHEYGDYYLNTNLEFQPQIISSYSRYLSFNETRNEEENLRMFILQDDFFNALKVGSKKWKDAVKLLYIYILEKEG